MSFSTKSENEKRDKNVKCRIVMTNMKTSKMLGWIQIIDIALYLCSDAAQSFKIIQLNEFPFSSSDTVHFPQINHYRDTFSMK